MASPYTHPKPNLTFLILLLLSAFNCQAEDNRLAPTLAKQKQMNSKADSAETLYHLSTTQLHNDGHWEKTVYISIRVNNLASARDYGRIKIPFNHYYSTVTLDFAGTLTTDGILKQVKEDAIQQRLTGGGQDFYSDRSELVFSLPEISPGSIIEFQYSQKSNELAFPSLYSANVIPNWFQSTSGDNSWRADFVHNHSYALHYSSNVNINVKKYANFKPKLTVKKSNGFTTKTWSSTNVEALSSERWYPLSETAVPQLRISNLSHWSDVNTWSWEKIKDKFKPTNKLRSIVQSFNLSEKASKDEKVRAVYAYLQNNIRYVFAHLGRGGYEPHFPDETINAGYGDCKDQAVLAVALLNMLGVSATPALIETPNAGKHDTDVVSLIFDHMIVHIPTLGGTSTQWLDTTGDHSLYPGMSGYLVNQNILIVNDENGKLSHIAQTDLPENKASLFLEYRTDTKGIVVADINIQLSGFYEQNMRSWWTYSGDKKNELNQFLSSLFNVNLGYKLDSQLLNSDQIFEPVSIEARFTFPEPEEETPPTLSASIIQALTLYADPSSLPNPKTRKNRFYEPYQYELEMYVQFIGEENHNPALLQSSDGFRTPHFSLEQNISSSNNTLSLAISFKREALDLSIEEYSKYHKAVNKIIQAPPWVVRQYQGSSTTAKLNLNNAQRKFGLDSIQYKLTQTKNLIDQGKFEEALPPAIEATQLDLKNGQAWYLLGTAQGLNAMFDESNNSFQKAEALGYLP